MSSSGAAASLPTISAIIPTTCEARRWESLQKAIASLQSQEGAAVQVVVVVNGERFDPARLEELKRTPDLLVHYLHVGSLPLAQRTGRSLVTGEYFCFLDDDDEYLPGALQLRLAPLLADSQLAFVSTNGYKITDGVEEELLPRELLTTVQADPLAALSHVNWLASCGGLFRSASVPVDYFDGETAFFEWTYLAYKLALDLRMAVLGTPTFRIHDTAESLSKSTAYEEAEIQVLTKILALNLPPKVRRALRAKIGRVWHTMADTAWRQGARARAWRFHLTSLLMPGGHQYLLFSRKLFVPLSGQATKP